jgi:hypothetical protein
MSHPLFLSITVLVVSISFASAQPRPLKTQVQLPGPAGVNPRLPLTIPGPRPPVAVPMPNSPFQGLWLFRGDRSKRAFIQSSATPRGQLLVLTNENGTQALGTVSPDGRRVTVPAWRIVGTLRPGNRVLVWSNGDFWAR